MVSEMVQNSQSLYSFTFNALFIIHKYIYSHSTTKFLFKKYIYSHLTTYFLFTKIFTHIYGCIYSHSTVYIRSHSQSKYWFNTVQYSFNIFCAPPLRIIRSQLPTSPPIFLRSLIKRSTRLSSCAPEIMEKPVISRSPYSTIRLNVHRETRSI